MDTRIICIFQVANVMATLSTIDRNVLCELAGQHRREGETKLSDFYYKLAEAQIALNSSLNEDNSPAGLLLKSEIKKAKENLRKYFS